MHSTVGHLGITSGQVSSYFVEPQGRTLRLKGRVKSKNQRSPVSRYESLRLQFFRCKRFPRALRMQNVSLVFLCFPTGKSKQTSSKRRSLLTSSKINIESCWKNRRSLNIGRVYRKQGLLASSTIFERGLRNTRYEVTSKEE